MWEPKKELLEQINGKLHLISRIEEIAAEVKSSDQIVTSCGYPNIKKDLRIENLPDGFEQFQLPITFDNAAAFLTTAEPNAFFPEHVHRTVSVFRVIVAGCIYFQEKELTIGDWMFVPAGCPYWIKAGSTGATIIHVYDTPPD